jgi:cytidylate kinase
MGAYAPFNDILSNDGLFKLQSDTIRSLAEKQSCVMVGRCADYILRNEPSCVSVFIHNTAENRINRIMEYDKVTEQEAKDRMASIDKSRSSYYNYYTNKAWGVASSYHLSIDATT